jgi:hypothetical protein
VSHQHDRTYTNEDNNATIESHQLPIPLNWKVLVQPNQVTMKPEAGFYSQIALKIMRNT